MLRLKAGDHIVRLRVEVETRNTFDMKSMRNDSFAA